MAAQSVETTPQKHIVSKNWLTTSATHSQSGSCPLSFFHSGTHILACLYLNKTSHFSLWTLRLILEIWSHRPHQGRTSLQHSLAQNQYSDSRKEKIQTSFPGYSEQGPYNLAHWGSGLQHTSLGKHNSTHTSILQNCPTIASSRSDPHNTNRLQVTFWI